MLSDLNGGVPKESEQDADGRQIRAKQHCLKPQKKELVAEIECVAAVSASPTTGSEQMREEESGAGTEPKKKKKKRLIWTPSWEKSSYSSHC